jgi:hypothetical protein
MFLLITHSIIGKMVTTFYFQACWSQDGGQIYAGRRNGTVDVWDVRLMGRHSMTGLPKLLKTLRNPTSSGVVSCVVPFPDCRHIARLSIPFSPMESRADYYRFSASIDNIRLWNVADAPGDDSSMAKPRGPAPFKIIPGHHGGYISQMRTLFEPSAYATSQVLILCRPLKLSTQVRGSWSQLVVIAGCMATRHGRSSFTMLNLHIEYDACQRLHLREDRLLRSILLYSQMYMVYACKWCAILQH